MTATGWGGVVVAVKRGEPGERPSPGQRAACGRVVFSVDPVLEMLKL